MSLFSFVFVQSLYFVALCSGQNTAYLNNDIPFCFEYVLAFVR